MVGFCKDNNEISVFLKGREFISGLRNCQPSKEDVGTYMCLFLNVSSADWRQFLDI
jgi:hypothetical protein